MRTLALAVLALVLLAGCSDGGGKQGAPADSFDDLDLKATETTGILRGVVVDPSIRPLPGVDVSVAGPEALPLLATSDDEGRFAFDGLLPGTYFVQAKLLNYKDATTTIEVVAGDTEPPVARILLEPQFTQQAFSEQLKFEGFIACGVNAYTVAPCVTDFTQVAPPCNGGCVEEMRTIMGDRRDYTTRIGEGWQTLVVEMTWKPSAQATSTWMGFVVSHNNRTTSHSFGQADGETPIRWEANVGEEAAGAGGPDPTIIPAEGWPDLLIFSNVRTSPDQYAAVTVNQAFQVFQHNFYYGKPPEGWAITNGDEPPF